jgi:serine protease
MKQIIIFFIFFVWANGLLASQKGIDYDWDKDEIFAYDEVIVKFKKGVDENVKKAIHGRMGAFSYSDSYKKVFQVVKIKKGRVKKKVEAYSRLPQVEYAEPNYIYRACFKPNDEYYSYQWNFTQIHMEEAWEYTKGIGVRVAIVDTGIDPNGIDSFGSRLLTGHSSIPYSIKPIDFESHGTHVAGTVGQETNNLEGVARIAFEAYILPVKVLNAFGSGLNSWISDGIRWAADNEADVINLSLGGPSKSNILQEAINYAFNAGVTLVAASGNDGSYMVNYPAAYENVIAVGAVGYDKSLAPYSNKGPEIDLVAPGGDTTKDLNQDGFDDGIIQETFKKLLFGWKRWDYEIFQGTSMATPHVSGVAALIKAIHPEYSPTQIKQALISTALDLGVTGKDSLYGYGLLDASEAVKY